MASKKWCLNGVKEVMPRWCHNMMPKWCQRSDASMVSQHWCRDGVMHSWCCGSVMQQWRLKYPPRWSSHSLGLTWVWPSKILVFGPCFLGLKAPRFKGNKHQKEHPKSSMGFPTLTIWHQWSTFCLIVLDPIWNYPCCYWLFSEVPNPTKHVRPWMKTVIWGVPWKFEDTISGIPPWHLTVFLAPSRRQ